MQFSLPMLQKAFCLKFLVEKGLTASVEAALSGSFGYAIAKAAIAPLRMTVCGGELLLNSLFKEYQVGDSKPANFFDFLSPVQSIAWRVFHFSTS
jgi:hypothetical protein